MNAGIVGVNPYDLSVSAHFGSYQGNYIICYVRNIWSNYYLTSLLVIKDYPLALFSFKVNAANIYVHIFLFLCVNKFICKINFQKINC